MKKRGGHWFGAGVRFANLGALSFLLVFGITAIGHELLRLSEEIAYLIALVVALFVNYWGARWYVYRSFHVSVGKQAALFLGSTIAFRGGEFISFLIVNGVFGVHYLITVILVMALSFVLKFVFFRTYVFTNHEQ